MYYEKYNKSKLSFFRYRQMMRHQEQYQLIKNNRELAIENSNLDTPIVVESNDYAQDEQWLSKHVLTNYMNP